MTTRIDLIGFLAAACLIHGCSGGEAVPENPAPESTTGSDEQVVSPADEVASEPPIEEASGPASFIVHAKVAGAEVSAHVRVLDAAGEVIAEGDAGTSLQAPSGDHRMSVQITDAAALIDQPTQTQEITLSRGNNPDVELKFPWAKVQLNVIVNGKSEPNARVKLQRKDSASFELKSGAAFTPVSPGRYEAEVLVKGSTIKVSGILFPEGATQTVPVAVQL